MSDLFAAIESGDRARVEELLLAGADPNTVWMPVSQDAEVPESTGFTILMHAVTCHQDAIVELLLQHGAEIEALDKDGMSALMYAAGGNPWQEDISILKLLLAQGADPNLYGPAGNTALSVAAYFINHKKAALLMEAGAKPTLTDAVWLGDVGLVRQLMQEGVDINLSNSSQLTALSYAINFALLTRSHEMPKCVWGDNAHARYQEIQDLLMSAGARLSLLDTTALNDLESTRVLLDAGHDINARFNDEITPLHRAARDGHLEMVKMLMKRGADVSAEDWDWYTPLTEAENSGHHEIVALLRAAGAKRQGEEGTEAYRLSNPD